MNSAIRRDLYSRRRGYTLMELLTVLAVLAVVSTIGMTILFRVNDYWNVTSIRSNLNAAAETAFATMQRDFDQVLSAKRSGISMTGSRRLEEKKRYGLVQLEDDRVTLPVETVQPETGQIERYNVMYHIARDGSTPILMRTLGALGANPPAGANHVVLEGVLSMRVEYHDGVSWLPEWNQPLLPEAVRVWLVLINPDRPWEQISREAVFAIHVK